MKKLNLLAISIKTALFAGAFTASGFATAAEEDSVEQVERIEVTGSRITRAELEPTQPITVVDADFIKNRGFTNAADAVLDIPGVARGLTPTTAGEEGNSQALGQRTINLYGLGSQRTLTLINGSRFVSSVSPLGGGASGLQVDTNNIPMALIDRVDVVKAGGAAIYGADAVAGVVNYILKKDYEGAEFAADYKTVGDTGADEKSVRALFGANIGQGKGNVVFALEYNETDTIKTKDVASLADSVSSYTPVGDDVVLNPDGTQNKGQVKAIRNGRAGILSFSGLVSPGPLAITNRGLGAWNDGQFWQFDPAGNGGLVNYNPGNPTGNAVWASGGDGLDLAATTNAQVGSERYNLTAITNYELAENLNLNITAFSNRSDSSFSGYQASKYSSGAFGDTSAALKFNTSHPYLTQSSRDILEGYLGGQGDFYLHKGWVNLGVREIINEAVTNSIKVGLDGSFELLNDEWTWNVSYQKGASSVYNKGSSVSDHRFFAAMDVGINPNTNQLDCKFNYEPNYDDNLKANGFGLKGIESVLGKPGSCSPLNPFGDASEAAISYVNYNTTGKTKIEQDVFQAVMSGSLFELPAGNFETAFGYERRTEFGGYYSGGTGVLTGNADSSTEGEYVTEDVFAEIYLPIISSDMNIPLVNSLSLEASFRQIDNSRSGKDDVWAVGVNFRPTDDLVIKANVSETVRAPSVSELFQPVLEGTSFASDPCDQKHIGKGPSPDVRKANCAAQGIPGDFVGLAENASRSGFSGGNDLLKNEQAKTSNVGILYSPNWAKGLYLSVDWVKIDISDAIVSFELQDVMEACYDSTEFPNKFCSNFSREANFQLPANDAYRVGYVNAALRQFEAYEYSAQYVNELRNYPLAGSLLTDVPGELSFTLRAMNQKKNATSNTGFDFTDTTGQFNNPDWRSDFSIRYSLDDLHVFTDFDYQGRGVRNIDSKNDNDYLDLDGNPYSEIPSYTTFNMGAVYDLTDSISLRAKIDNVSDWQPKGLHRVVNRWMFGRSYSLGITVKL